MADYRELLSRAIAALPENNGAARRQVYEKARSALVAQLRAIQPVLPAREITQHRLQLEDCIRQVEQSATDALLSGLKELDEPSAAQAGDQSVTETPQAAQTEIVPEAPAGPNFDVAGDEPEPETVAAIEPEPVEDAVAQEQASDEPVFDEPDFGDDENDVAAPTEVVDATSSLNQKSVEHEPVEHEPVEDEQVDDQSDDIDDKAIEPEPDDKHVADALQDALVAQASRDDEPVAGPVWSDAPHKDRSNVVDFEPSVPMVPLNEVDETLDADAESSDDEAPNDPRPMGRSPLPVRESPVIGFPGTGRVASNNPKPGSIDYLIAQAQAAATRAATPVRWQMDSQPRPDSVEASQTQTQTEGAAAIAMSRVLEVEVDADNEREGDPQSTIDRAIQTLDREARGEKSGSDDKTDSVDAAAAVVGASTDASRHSQVVDRDSGSGNALTIFLVVFAILLAGVGGAGYWAWREGYIDLDTMLAQNAVVETPVVEQQTADNQTSSGPGNTEPTPNAVTPLAEEMGKSEERLVPEGTVVEPVQQSTSTAEPVTTVTATEPDTATGTPVTVAEETPAPTVAEPAAADDKAEDRLPSDTNTTTQTPVAEAAGADTAAATPQAELQPIGGQSLLLEASSQGTTGAVPFSGTVDWTRGVDELGQPTLLAHANIPARNLDVDVVISRNTDLTLPASHLMEVNFTVSESFFGGGIAGMPGVLLKNEELVKGVPLVGASVRIVGNSFLFALSNTDTDRANNVKLLRDLKWIDLAMVYSTGNRAIITLEKDTAAQKMFEDVMAIWASDASTPSQ